VNYASSLYEEQQMNIEQNVSELLSRRQVTNYALRLRGIRVNAHMGVSAAERAKFQQLVVAVDLELKGERYPVSDELDRAVDYAQIVRIADEATQGQADLLLETFALRVARRLAEHWPAATAVCVAVTKAVVPTTTPTDAASVEVTLGRSSK
jgi:dihydroneopterin aldolase